MLAPSSLYSLPFMMVTASSVACIQRRGMVAEEGTSEQRRLNSFDDLLYQNSSSAPIHHTRFRILPTTTLTPPCLMSHDL